MNDDDEKETLVELLKKEPMPWVNWWNGDGGVDVDDWKLDGYPTVYVLDHKGVIRYKDVFDEDLDRAVDTLLAEMAAQGGR